MPDNRSMTKLCTFVGLAVLLVGCATSAKRMNELTPGMSKAQVIQILDEPDSTSMTNGHEVLRFRLKPGLLDDPTTYLVFFKDGRVTEFGHVTAFMSAEEREADQRARQQALQYWMNRSSQPSTYQPVQMYQAPRPTQTNCQTRWVGNTAVSDCTSNPTGIDSSIYNNAR